MITLDIDKGYNVRGFCGIFFSYFLIIFFCCFVVAIFDLVHDVEAVVHLP